MSSKGPPCTLSSLPIELAERIFHLLAATSRRECLTLCLVCRFSHKIALEHLFSTVLITTRRQILHWRFGLEPFGNTEADCLTWNFRHAEVVRNIWVSPLSETDLLPDMIAPCSNLVHLGICVNALLLLIEATTIPDAGSVRMIVAEAPAPAPQVSGLARLRSLMPRRAQTLPAPPMEPRSTVASTQIHRRRSQLATHGSSGLHLTVTCSSHAAYQHSAWLAVLQNGVWDDKSRRSPIYDMITHLYLNGLPSPLQPNPTFARVDAFPRLTHLTFLRSVYDHGWNDHSLDSEIMGRYEAAISEAAKSSNLQMIVLRMHMDRFVDPSAPSAFDYPTLESWFRRLRAAEPRLFFVLRAEQGWKQWKDKAEGGESVWAKACRQTRSWEATGEVWWDV